MAMGGIGLTLGGVSHASWTKEWIQKALKEAGYDISSDDILLHNMDKMPEELTVLCKEYEEAERYQYEIQQTGTVVTMAGTVLMDIGYLWEVAGASILSSGKKLGENLKNWINSWNKGGSGTLTGKLDGLKPDERSMVEDLLNSGKNVEIIPRSNIPNDKTPDFFVNGVKTELKTLNGTSLNTPVTRIQDGFEQGAQTVINRALGKYGGTLPGGVEIWTNEGILRR